MPKTFTDKEKEIIRNTLISQGKILFSKYGLKKTSITELTNIAGIAQGTFYNFFESKEELYFEILEQEESHSAEYLENVVKSSKSAKESIKKIIKCTFNLFERNQFIRRIFESKDYDLMLRKLPNKKLENHQKNDTLRVLNTIMSIKQKDELIDTSPEVIAGLLRGISILSFHQEEIGKEVYPEVVDLLADIVANGLVK
ncbi:MAG: TetR/AcrR family transcriptional regulator [Methanobacterium sp.]|uniref:TetR/AcrR family transcriptional regulator n=1 Tax=Methanobacterium sp. TaxID=2164 RepID=UPI003C77F4C3